MKQFVPLATLRTCFIDTRLEVGGKWWPEPRGSSSLPTVAWGVNYAIGLARWDKKSMRSRKRRRDGGGGTIRGESLRRRDGEGR